MAEGKDAIDREMERARRLIRKGRSVVGPDYRALSDIAFKNIHYFMQSLREIVMTTETSIDQPG